MEMEQETLTLSDWEEYSGLEYAEQRWDTTRVMYQMRLPKTFQGLLWRSWAADLESKTGCAMTFRSRAQDDENNAVSRMNPLPLGLC